MKSIILKSTLLKFPAAFAILIFTVVACKNQEKVTTAIATELPKVSLETEIDSLNYALGAFVSGMLEEQEVEMKTKAITAGMVDQRADSAQLSDAEVQSLMRKLQNYKIEKEGRMALAAGKEYLAANASKSGVMVTSSGLQYEVIKEAEGAKPLASDRVTVHYTGTTIDGTKFDSSLDRGEPSTFGLKQVIAGWTEGLQLMSVGSEYKFTIPSELGYGLRGQPRAGIAPNSVLIFTVELIGIESKE